MDTIFVMGIRLAVIVMGITVSGQESKQLSHKSGSFWEGTHLFLALPSLSPLVYSRPNNCQMVMG